MRRTIHNLIFLCLALLWHDYAHGQLEEIARFTTEDGLPSNTVFDILEDKDGYIWMATAAGVVKWNGYDWKVFGKEEGLPTSEIWQLHLDNRQRLWCINHINPGYFILNDSIYQVSNVEYSKISYPSIETLENGLAVLQDDSWAYTDSLVTQSTDLNKVLSHNIKSKIYYSSIFRHIIHPRSEEIVAFFDKVRLGDYESYCWYFLHKDTPIIVDRYKSEITVYDSSFQERKNIKVPQSIGAFHPFKTKSGEFTLSGTQGQISYSTDTWSTIDSVIYDDQFNHSRSFLNKQFCIAGSLGNGLRIYSRNYTKSSEISSLKLCCANLGYITQSTTHTGVHSDREVKSFKNYSHSGKMVVQNENYCYLIKDDTVSYWTSENTLNQITLQRNPKYYLPKYRGKIKLSMTSSMTDFDMDDENIYITDDILLWHGKREKETILDTIHFPSSSLFHLNNQVFALSKNKIYRLNGGDKDLFWESPHQVKIKHCMGAKNTLICYSDSLIFEVTPISDATVKVENEKIMNLTFNGENIAYNDNNFIHLFDITKEEEKATPIKNWIPSNTVNKLVLHNDSLTIIAGEYSNKLSLNDFSSEKKEIDIKLQPEEPMLDEQNNTQHRNINFNLTAISPFSLGKIDYFYRLLPADSNWIPSRSREIRFSSLAPKKYTIEARAFDAFGVNSPTIRYQFRVLPFWYENIWFYITASGLIIVLTSFFLTRNTRRKARRAAERQELERRISTIQLDALRSQMNPHFVFNSLAAIQNYIRLSKKEEADDYLTLFAQLIRSFFEYSQKPHISIQAELDLINKYINLENLRFNNEIDYELTIHEDVDRLTIIPSLILQPFIENSIHHGLFHKSGYKKLSLTVEQKEDTLLFTITDNGIGRKKSGQFRSKNHKSRGSSLMRERFETINATGNFEVNLKIDDFDNPTGTQVEIIIKNSES